MTKKSLVAAGLFVLGCATGGVASHVVEPARAQNESASEAHQRWQYRCLREANEDKIQAVANQLGKQGWEMAAAVLTGTSSFADPIWCFKR
jgi:hypothetical protein